MAGPHPASATRSRSDTHVAPWRQSGVRREGGSRGRHGSSEHRMVAATGLAERDDVPVLDDASALGAIEADQRSRRLSVSSRADVQSTGRRRRASAARSHRRWGRRTSLEGARAIAAVGQARLSGISPPPAVSKAVRTSCGRTSGRRTSRRTPADRHFHSSSFRRASYSSVENGRSPANERLTIPNVSNRSHQ